MLECGEGKGRCGKRCDKVLREVWESVLRCEEGERRCE